MRVLLQRVAQARVRVEGQVVGEIGPGLLLFLGVHRDDDASKIPYLVEKATHLRIFEDSERKMNLSVKDVGGEILLVSQFTLYANCQSGRRPSFTEAMAPSGAKVLYEAFIQGLKEAMGEDRIATGEFGAYMQVELINDGPVTLQLCSLT
ncbi:MAG: D-aminoacyl-tRNA deacylase [Chlamydiae bacterium]|nr:D-aminoacyl-tRNA deacylase [Chlamydiota bacterium]